MSSRRSPSLRLLLAGTMVAVGIAPTLALGIFAVRFAASRVREQIAARNEQVARAISAELSRTLEAQLVHLKEIAFAVGDSRESDAEIQDLLSLQVRANPPLSEILLANRSGRVVAAMPSDPDAIGTDLSGHPFVQRAWSTGEPTWSPATISMRTGLPVITLIVPAQKLAVVAYVDLGVLAEIVERTRVGVHGQVSVIDQDGAFLANRDPRLAREQENARGLLPVREALEGREGTAEFDFQGQRWLGSAVTVPPTGWVVLVSERAERAYREVGILRNALILALLGTVAVAAIVGAASTRRILRQVAALSAGARRIAAGDYDLVLPPRTGRGIREVDDLAGAFGAMATAVREREEELARSEGNYRTIVSTPLVGVVRASLAGEILFANDAFARMAGAESGAALVGRHVGPFWADPGERARVIETTVATGSAVNVEMRLRSAAGEERRLLVNVAREADTLTTVAVDITDRKRADAERAQLEHQLAQAQRLEALGRLAGGIAHDFNNILTAIVGFANALRDALPGGHPEQESVDGILDASKRAAQLTRGLLAYGRKQMLDPRPTDVSEVIRTVEKLLRRVIGEDVELSIQLPETPLVAVVDPGQIEQVLVNLSANARDAMSGGGALRISAEGVELEESEALRVGLASGGAFVRIAVSDSGSGMEPEVVARAFEPFFTTKPAGKGTGLGLAIVYGIVRQHGGAVTVTSGPGDGTEVTVLLRRETGATEASSSEASAPAPAPGGRETVLLGEDDPLVRRSVRRALQRAGYEVIEALDGEDAVEKFTANQGRIGLCLLDVVMPRKNGREAAEAIAAIRPGIPVLLTSGYAADVLEDRGLPTGAADIIAKPVAPDVLLRKIRELIDGAG